MIHKLSTKIIAIVITLLTIPNLLIAASGIFLRGDVNNWAANAEWEFVDTGNGIYVLYDKVLSGAFKIADLSWSANCNYGASTTSNTITIDSPYTLNGGSNPANISCGGATLNCKQIILTIKSTSEATLILKSNDNSSGLEQVYVIGDNNGWNYADNSGRLALINVNDSVFTGRVTLPAVNGAALSKWNIFQQLGMGGRWGLATDATTSITKGKLTKGGTGKMGTTPGTYDFTFSLKTGDVSLQLIESVPTTLTVMPAKTTIVPTVPDKVRILSLNNSLINYARQDTVFNKIAATMGKNAIWTAHSNLGKTLDYHWIEADDTGNNVEGQPSAQTMIRMRPWTHIVLQEQTEKPRKNFEGFRESVRKWVNFIRTSCPNPNAIIILPVNWPLLNDTDNLYAFSKILQDNYRKVAQEFGVVIAPVGQAYEECFKNEGKAGFTTWFRPSEENNNLGQDDRHPSQKSTYMAACVEYGIIFGENPLDINYNHTILDNATSQSMRQYAANAINSTKQVIDNHSGKVNLVATMYDQFGMELSTANGISWTVNGGGTIIDNVFTANGSKGTFEVKASNENFTATALITIADAETAPEEPVISIASKTYNEDFNAIDNNKLPKGWRIDRQTANPRIVGSFTMAVDTVMYVQTNDNITLPANAKNGTWSFGTDTDRALGGISTGVANATRCVNVYAHLLNSTGTDTTNPIIGYNVKKYRQGANPAGFNVQMYYSQDGKNWQKGDDKFTTLFNADNATQGYHTIPGETVAAGGELPFVWKNDTHLYLAWNISVTTGNICNAAMALAIDDLKIDALNTSIENHTISNATTINNHRYNLSGQRVNNDYKGIAIQNGRKIIIR